MCCTYPPQTDLLLKLLLSLEYDMNINLQGHSSSISIIISHNTGHYRPKVCPIKWV